MKRHFQCAEQQVSLSNVTKYCACHENWFSFLVLVMYETSFTMRGATGVILQRHQILCLPRQMILIFGPCHIWNIISNARSNRCHPPTSPNFVPAMKNDSHDWYPGHIWNVISNARSNRCHCQTSPNTVPATKNDSHDWSLSQMKHHLQCAKQQVSSSNLAKYSACHEKRFSCLILVTDEASFTMRGATGAILEPHQILVMCN